MQQPAADLLKEARRRQRLSQAEFVDRATSAGPHVMAVAVDGANTDAIAFHERLGFTEVARIPEVGRKFDRWLELDLIFFPCIIEP